MYFDSSFTTSPETTDYYRKRYEGDARATITDNGNGTITVTSNGALRFY